MEDFIYGSIFISIIAVIITVNIVKKVRRNNRIAELKKIQKKYPLAFFSLYRRIGCIETLTDEEMLKLLSIPEDKYKKEEAVRQEAEKRRKLNEQLVKRQKMISEFHEAIEIGMIKDSNPPSFGTDSYLKSVVSLMRMDQALDEYIEKRENNMLPNPFNYFWKDFQSAPSKYADTPIATYKILYAKVPNKYNKNVEGEKRSFEPFDDCRAYNDTIKYEYELDLSKSVRSYDEINHTYINEKKTVGIISYKDIPKAKKIPMFKTYLCNCTIPSGSRYHKAYYKGNAAFLSDKIVIHSITEIK